MIVVVCDLSRKDILVSQFVHSNSTHISFRGCCCIAARDLLWNFRLCLNSLEPLLRKEELLREECIELAEDVEAASLESSPDARYPYPESKELGLLLEVGGGHTDFCSLQAASITSGLGSFPPPMGLVTNLSMGDLDEKRSSESFCNRSRDREKSETTSFAGLLVEFLLGPGGVNTIAHVANSQTYLHSSAVVEHYCTKYEHASL
jgi:hypothetical protein